MRKPRQLRHNAAYHVTAKINRGEFALEDKLFKQLMLEVIKRAYKKYKFRLINFCIMGNHIHLFIQPLENENLSRIMQWILSVFAKSYNCIMNIKGHVWYDRFHSVIINSIRQMLRTFMYITYNPVKAQITKKALDFEFNGICYIQKKDFSLIDKPDKLFQRFIKRIIRETAQ